MLYVSAQGHNQSTRASPYCTKRLCPGSQSLNKYIIMLNFTSLPRVTIILQVHHHSVLYVSARSHNPSTSTSPFCTLRLCSGSQSLYTYHLTVLYVSARGHNHATSTSPCCTLCLCPGSQSLYKYITTLYLTSLPRFTNPLQVHHHAVLYVSARGHNNSTSTSPCCSIRLCPRSQCFYKFITMLHFTSLPGVTIILQVHHRAVLYVSARGHTPSTSTSPYCTLRLCLASQSLYKYITMLYFTSLPGVTILCTCITTLYFTYLPGV